MRLRKSFSLSVLPLVLLAGCCSDHAALEKQNAEILAEMKKINARLERLEKQSRQNRMNARSIVTGPIVSRPVMTRPRIVLPDRNKLSQIRKLPEKPTDEEIIDYIRQIDEATVGQTRWSDRDPQVALYEKIGPGHLHLLLPYLEGRSSSFHVHYALPKLVGEGDRELVRRSLNRYPILTRCVVRKGWLKEMRKEVISLLKQRMRHIAMYEVTNCIPDLVQSPEDLKLLTDLYIHAPGGYVLLDGLKKVPGADIRKLVEQAWAEAQKNPADSGGMSIRARDAVRDGGPNAEAVKYLLKVLIAKGQDELGTGHIITSLLSRCDFPIYGPDRLAEWYEKNAGRIVFDPAKGKYVLKK